MMIEPAPAVNGLANAKVIHAGKEAVLHSRDPVKEAERIASRLNPEIEWTVVCGMGLGYLVEYLFEHTSSRIVIFEHTREILDYAIGVRQLDAILDHPRVSRFSDPNALLRFLEDNRIRELNFTVHRPYMTLFPEVYSSVEGMLAAHLSRKQINDATLKRFQKVWLRNIVKNSSRYTSRPGLNRLRHSLKGKPAVIVGAGPSLAKNIALLKEAQSRLAIIATDTALPMLQYNGIAADFVVSVDPQNKNTLFLLYSDGTKTRLVMDGASSFLTLSKFPAAETILTDSIFPVYTLLDGFFEPKGGLAAGGSVSTTAFDLARKLGCDPIILVGQDLAYSGRQTHAPGNVLEEFLYYRINRLKTYDNYNTRSLLFSDKFFIDGWDGSKVPTDRKFMTFLEWFVREIRETKAGVVNATEGGAHIEGAIQMTLSDSLRLYCGAPIDKSVSTDYEPEDASRLRSFMRSLVKVCESWLPEAVKARDAALRCRVQFGGGKDLSGLFSPMNRFDETVLKSLKSGTTTAKFLEFVMQNSISEILASPDAGDLSEEMIERWVNIYSEAVDAITSLKRLIAKFDKLSVTNA